MCLEESKKGDLHETFIGISCWEIFFFLGGGGWVEEHNTEIKLSVDMLLLSKSQAWPEICIPAPFFTHLLHLSSVKFKRLKRQTLEH